jgi:hypothetical protein
VRIKPDGSFDDPGWRNFAIMPATKPIMMVQMMLMSALPQILSTRVVQKFGSTTPR